MTIFAGYLVEENLYIQTNGLENGYRSVRPDRAITLEREEALLVMAVNKKGREGRRGERKVLFGEMFCFHF